MINSLVNIDVQDILKKMRIIYDSISMSELYDNTSIYNRPLLSDEANMLVTEHFDSVFCPKKVKKYITRCDNLIVIKSDEVTFYIYFEKTTKVTMTKLFLSMKQAIVTKRFFNIGKHLNIHIVLSPYKRYMPSSKKEYICECHINGGFTYPNGKNVYVVREEEYTKVMIHEILHHCSEIHNDGFVERQLNELKNVFNIAKETKLIPNEAIIEFWANLTNCAYLSFEYNQSFDSLLKKEVDFSLYQCHKILDKQGNSLWYETTNAYCYIIFKTILLKNMTKLSEYTYPYNPEYIKEFLIKYKDSIKNKVNKNKDFYDNIISKKSLRMTFLAD
jgi:hypothetical protein